MRCVATVPLTIRVVPAEPFVLLVDDHEPSLRGLLTVLESVGYSCVATPSPADALSYCDSRRPALVVTDLTMPRLDGHGLAQGLKARYPALPILLVTGEQLDPATQTVFRRIFSGVFSKPLEIEPFLKALDTLLPPERVGLRP